MTQLPRLAVFCLSLSLGLFVSQTAQAASLRGETEVNRPTVKLSDVFDDLPDGVDCDIARAPAPGKSITYDANVLTHLVKQYKLDWQPQSSDHITIRTVGTKLSNEEIRSAITEKVRAQDIKGDIDVVFDNRLTDIILPSDRAASFALNNFSYDGINKRFRTELSADGFSGPINLPLMGHIVVRHSVPVLARRLEAGTLVGANDLDWVKVTDDRMIGVVTSQEQLIDHELRHDMEAGQPFHEHDVAPPRMVVRGTLVTMKIETPFMVIAAQGKALQDGKLGDVVRVINTQSNRTVEGVVDGAGVVRIPTVQKFAAANVEGR
jgi:flagella basal body P-ring formation protein FlgA